MRQLHVQYTRPLTLSHTLLRQVTKIKALKVCYGSMHHGVWLLHLWLLYVCVDYELAQFSLQ